MATGAQRFQSPGSRLHQHGAHNPQRPPSKLEWPLLQMLVLPAGMQRIYLPPDSNTFVSCLAHCLRSSNYVNVSCTIDPPDTALIV